MYFRGVHSIEELLFREAAISAGLITNEISKMLPDFETIVININLDLLNNGLPPRMNWNIEDLVEKKLLVIAIDSVKDEIRKNPDLNFEDIIKLVASEQGTDMFLTDLGNSFKIQLIALISIYPQFTKALNDLGKAYKDYTKRLKNEFNWNIFIHDHLAEISENL